MGERWPFKSQREPVATLAASVAFDVLIAVAASARVPRLFKLYTEWNDPVQYIGN